MSEKFNINGVEPPTGDWITAPVELPARSFVLKPRTVAAFRQVPAYTKVSCACRRSVLRVGEKTCWQCQSEDEEKQELMAAVMVPITREEALAELRDLETCQDPEYAHQAAEMVLMQLLGDKEIADAFRLVPKWYA